MSAQRWLHKYFYPVPGLNISPCSCPGSSHYHAFPMCVSLSRYRARVEKVESAAKVHVFYIDYGNVSNNEVHMCVCVCISGW